MMDKIYNITLCIFIALFSIYSSNPTYEDFTAVPLSTIHIGSQSKKISLLINTLHSKSLLYTNSKRIYSQEIQRGRKSDVLIDKVTLDGQKIESFPFNLQIDETKLNNKDIQGEFGLGIDKQNSSDLVNILYDNQIVSSKTLEVEIKLEKNEEKMKINFPSNVENYKFCDLSSKKEFTEKDFYRDSWVCELSHIVIGSTYADLAWNKTLEVQGKVAFDSRTKFLYVPKKYIKYISQLWNLDKNECKIMHDLESDEKYYNCKESIENKFINMHSLYLIIGGYGYRLSPKELFEKDGKNIVCLIRFYNDDKNLWVLGVPFFREYKIAFDYNQTRIGFSGQDILNFEEDYQKWANENSEKKASLLGNYTREEIIMIVGIIIGCLILLYVLFTNHRNHSKIKNNNHINLDENYDQKDKYK